ncbi:hypothetical protein JAAARDRAFT_30692 [Jaapia argillacea MUCL 33604]|uniref:Uncharacterized protein n=1 Tax=Jaapia argillacea MUCL 33604 TaxID=933084 RepID=A0A067Q716_9AGAM|nr:hypothetical protein JAAARDRAFT_30692 [Jaapia argillacea MUCL 33604]
MPSAWHLPKSHPTLEWIDLWTDEFGQFTYREETIIKYRRDSPECKDLLSFKGVRLLDRSLFELRELPTSFPPSQQIADDDIIKHRLPRFSIVQTSQTILRDEWLDSFGDDEAVDSDDGSWVQSSSDEESQLDSGSDEGSGGWHGGGGGGGGDDMITHDLALQLYECRW